MNLKSAKGSHIKTRTPEEQEMLIDTSKMSAGQRDALEVAEAARGAEDARDSFAGRMLMGRYEAARLRGFPEQSEVDRAVGDGLVQTVSVFLAENLDPEAVDESRSIPDEIIDGLREIGVFRMKVPKEYGGLGLSQVNYNRVVHAIASYCGSTAVLVSAHQSIGVPQPLKMFGTEAQKAKFLPRIARGDLSAFALTEAGVGSDPAQMATTAVPTEDGRSYVINGEKLWTTNGPIAQLLVVMAQTPAKVVRGRERRRITAFIVEADRPGVEVVHRCDFMGLRGIHNGVLRFHDVTVPAENVLWGEGLGLKLALQTLNTGRLTLPAACAGMAKQCLRIAREWGAERVQWGRPIGEHEAGAEKIARIAATSFALDAVWRLTSHWADEQRDIRIEAGMAKLFASEACWRIIDETLQLRGGRGFERATSLRARGERPEPIERIMRDSRINTIIEGTSEIMRLFLAREALDPHLKLAADLFKPDLEMKRKVRAGMSAAAFYARWYPAQVLGGRLPFRYAGDGPLARHQRYIDRAAHRLAGALFKAMVKNGPKLERRQVVLGHLMDIGTDLFAMAATCGYAGSTSVRVHGAEEARTLADLFCRFTRENIETRFRALGDRDGKRRNALARRVLKGGYRWLEEGIIPSVPDTWPAPTSAGAEAVAAPDPTAAASSEAR